MNSAKPTANGTKNSLAIVELEDWEIEYLQRRFPDAILSNKNVAEADHLGDPNMLGVFVYSTINREVLKKFPSLKFIATMSTGFDHIDLEACRERKIVVSNVPSYGENTVAEQALALLLALTRKIIPAVERTRQGNFRLDGLRGVDMAGKTAGVIGTGRIGQRMISMLKGLQMNVIASDPHPQPEAAQRLGFTYVELDDLLRQSDIVTLHAPAIPATQHMLNLNRLRLMKPEAYLINTSRGSLIDTAALINVLEEGRLAGVGLDVLEEEASIVHERQFFRPELHEKYNLETHLADHVLLGHPRVIVTPHNAFNTREALQRILDTTIKNFEAFESGQPVNTLT